MSADPILLALEAVVAAVAGYGAGLLHFRSLARVAQRLVDGRFSAIWLQLARLGALGLFLYLCALVGPAALVGAAAGVLAGRARVLREAR